MKRLLLAALRVAIVAVLAEASAPAWADEDPAAYFNDECLDCHHRKKKPLEDKHLSRAEWAKAIDKMIELEKLDPVPPKAEIDRLLDWLAANHGPAEGAASDDAAKTQSQ